MTGAAEAGLLDNPIWAALTAGNQRSGRCACLAIPARDRALRRYRKQNRRVLHSPGHTRSA
jgi:hypothetical protein